MLYSLLDKLQCPDCHSTELFQLIISNGDNNRVLEGELTCSICASSFSIHKGIPILLPSYLDENTIERGSTLETTQKRKQIEHFNEIGANELEIARPHGCGRVYTYLIDTKINTVLNLYGRPLQGQSVLDICCGSGMDAEYLAREGANVVGVDISFGALLGAQERATRYGLEYDLVVGDAEDLPFQDQAFELSFVHDGLHHLHSPSRGFLEMARVSSSAVLLTEPARAFATAIAVQLGAAEAIEESGNRVHRFSEQELRELCNQASLTEPRMTRYAMYYRQEPLALFRLFESDLTFQSFRLSYRFFNILLGRLGNKIALVVQR